MQQISAKKNQTRNYFVARMIHFKLPKKLKCDFMNKVLYVQPRIRLGEWEAQIFQGFCDTNGSI